MKMIKRAAVGAVLAAGLAVTATGTASADNAYYSTCTKTNDASICSVWWTYGSSSAAQVGAVNFQSYAEKLYLNDYQADGRGVYAKLKWGSANVLTVYNTKGSGTSVLRDIEVAEGDYVWITACQTDDGALLNCVQRIMEA